jgi:hypothetical protein
MIHLKHFFLFGLLFFIMPHAFAQYPSTSTLIADVKKKDPNAFVTVTPVGSWKMTHDKVPEWKDPDACEHVVEIAGSKKPDGTWWTYKAFVIYNKVGDKMVFDRVFLIEDETSLNGVNMPESSFFLNTFIDKMNVRDESFLRGNSFLKDATNFYSYELKGKPRATGTSEQIVAYATITVVFDSYAGGGFKMQKRSRDVQLKFEKKGNDFVYLFGMHSQANDILLSETDFGSKAILETIPTFENSKKTLAEMTTQTPKYPEPMGSNGAGFPKDDELIALLEKTFLTKADNFKILFGERGKDMIIDVTFKVKDGEKAVSTDPSKMSKVYICNYIFFNEKEAEKKLTEITGSRELEINFLKEDVDWRINGAKFLTETEYIKQTSLNWSSYINTMRAKTYGKRVFGD